MTDTKPEVCKTCPKYEAKCILTGHWPHDSRVTFLLESPSLPDSRRPDAPDRALALLTKLVGSVKLTLAKQLPDGKLPYGRGYAAAAPGKPSKKVLEVCGPLWKAAWSNEYKDQQGDHVVIPLGMLAARSIGLTGRKITDLRGRVTTTEIDGKVVHVVPTLSLNHLLVKPGLVHIIKNDIAKAVKLAYLGENNVPKTIEELSKHYRFPRTIEEVASLCDEIINYYDPSKPTPPSEWPITVDTETNTLKPYRQTAKILIVSFGWDDGKSAAILLDHPDNTWYDPKDAWPHVARVLACEKPKAAHNWKYDLQFLERTYGYKVNNVVWDTMCGQHWLTEDSKGMYGLKVIGPLYAPEYNGYEDDLHQALRKGEKVAPTEDDVAKEVAELAEAAGGDSSSWLEESFSAEEAGEEDETDEDPNAKWQLVPTFPADATAEDIEAYKKCQTEWFAFDAAGEGKKRGHALMRWRKVAKKLQLPIPDPVPAANLVKKDKGFEEVSIETLLPYAAADTDVTRIILKGQYKRLNVTNKRPDADRVMKNLYIPASRTLGGLEYRGMKLDVERARDYDTQLSILLEDTQKKIWGLANVEFNLNASEQLAKVLQARGFGVLKQTKTGKMSTAKDVLIAYQSSLVEALSTTADSAVTQANQERLDFIESLLLFRAAQKMKGSFLRNLREYSALDGHIHTTFHLIGTSTGRLSSSKLNLQNLPLYMCRITRPIPGQDEPAVVHKGFNVKALLVPEAADEVVWNLDIKAAEIRVCCYYSRDVELIKAVKEGLDIHTYFLTRIKHPTLVGDEQKVKYNFYKKLVEDEDIEITTFRTAVKRTVFGTLYGARAKKIAAQVGCTEEFAQEIIDGLFAAFPGILEYISGTHAEVKEKLEARTVFGRFRRFWMASVSREHAAKAEREAVNFKIQSTSSDLVVAQLCEIDEHLHEIDAVMRLTVHDSMAGTIKKSRVKDMKAFFDKWLVQRIQERFPWMPVPFLYDLEVGPSYGEKMKLKDWLKEHENVANAA